MSKLLDPKNPYVWVAGALLLSTLVLAWPRGYATGAVRRSSTPTSTSRVVLPTATQEAGKVGSSWYHEGYRATLVAVQPAGAAQQGYEYIQVSVWLLNQSQSQVGYNELLFSVLDGKGNLLERTDSPSSYTAGRWLGTGELQPGGQVRGDLFFVVPVGDHQATLRWQPEVLRDTFLAWNLGL